MVVPGLARHLYGYEQADCRREGCCGDFLHVVAQQVYDARHTHADPDGKGIEGTGVGIVTFARLSGCLVEVKHNGDTGHEEQEEYHPELLDAFLTAPCLPEESDDSQYEGETIENVVSLVVFQFLREHVLVAIQKVVDERYAGDPVAVFYFAAALDVVLPSGKVPHEVAPVHEVELVGEEELDVVPLGWHVHHQHLSALIVGHVVAGDILPGLIIGGVCRAVHAGEEHVLRVFIFHTSRQFNVRVFFVG